jgi:uncharacterized membrane protein
MDRHRFIELARSQQWTPAESELAAQLLGMDVTIDQWRTFGSRLLRGVGAGALVAGVVCFIAANWRDFGIAGRFVLLQTLFLVAAGLAFWRPPPARLGAIAAFIAAFLSGCLLALYGQYYQTGADVYELFFAWALLALPFACAAGGATAALAIVVFNIGLALYASAFGARDWLQTMLFGWASAEQWAMAVAATLNALLILALGGRVAAWIRLLPLVFGLGFATSLAVLTVFDRSVLVWPLFVAPLALLSGLAWRLGRELRHILPESLAAAALIFVATLMVVRGLNALIDDFIGTSFGVALFIAVAAAMAATRLLARHRQYGERT